MELLPYQQEPCAKLTEILREKGSALDASDTGTGKTYTAVQVAVNLGIPVGIICPKAVIPSWQRVCKSAGLEPTFILNYEKLARGNTDYVIKVSNKFMWAFQGLLIWDECHRCKSPTSLNARMMMAAWDTKTLRCLCLSATAAQSPMDMRALGYVLGIHKNYNFWHWVVANGAKKNRWNGFEWRGSPEQLAAIHHHIFPDRGVRLKIKDLGTAFPDNLIIAEPLEMANTRELARVYEGAEEALAELEMTKADDWPNAMTIILRARQQAELLKVSLLVEMTKDLLDEGKSVVIFCNFNDTIDLLSAHLDTKCIIRQQPPEERQQNLDDFQSNKSRVILANIQAGGVGISLHDTDGGFPRVALLCPTYTAVDLKQALGRCHRAGGKSPVIQRLIYASGTVEEKVCQKVAAKLNNIELVNDDEVSDNLKWKSNTQNESTPSTAPAA